MSEWLKVNNPQDPNWMEFRMALEHEEIGPIVAKVWESSGGYFRGSITTNESRGVTSFDNSCNIEEAKKEAWAWAHNQVPEIVDRKRQETVAQKILEVLQKEEKGSHTSYWGEFKADHQPEEKDGEEYLGYEFNLDQDLEQYDGAWHIQVSPVGESYLYDGFWRDSEDRKILAVIVEACRGAMIWDEITETLCEHGKGLTHFCEPCGRISGG